MDRSSFLSKLDIFPKIDSCFTRSSVAGGTVSIFTYIFITIVLFFEVFDYLDSDVIYNHSVDTVFDKKLNINVDITVATPCSNVGADVMDSTNKHSMYNYGHLKESGTNFQLSGIELNQWNEMKKLSRFILSGNFHIAAGKYLPLPIGHAHLSLIDYEKSVNFSHRIEKFSFGDMVNTVNTLDGVEKITHSNYHLYQYYLKVVLTNVKTFSYKGETYQYSVTERDIIVNHEAGLHGVPGIYFKYEIEGLKIDVIENNLPIWKFLVRLCAIVGGIIELSIMFNQLITNWIDVINSKYPTCYLHEGYHE
ncbi:Endoplasmic reticulum-Golgi intermediate compartment protein 2 [Dermatophagoides pteronyssinus]|uniref:Endoplasmic reticulum-Golgi intermediate compartment protein 2 n=1 Tax=Dermatophagoides pteronyssinus TaxID=6956 RepID=A0ABQ8IYB7_DERPT|nr:Endoplasmic reticulum-Golgi intermediate compartment protein 2 [Dermatophagoides pteronyssinus]